MAEFKPNIYPIMYWGLLYGLIAGFILFIVFLLSTYLTLIWFPVFLAGVIWGGYRNYKKQKTQAGAGQSSDPQPPIEEFKDAAKDIFSATRDMMAEQAAENIQEEQAEAAGVENTESEESEAAPVVPESPVEAPSGDAEPSDTTQVPPEQPKTPGPPSTQ